MGDENMNKSEDTSVLFVSGQRKKQAEDEARRKAEEEKARKEAEEAEIQRREEEVASRINQAEVLKKTLEEQEKERNKNKKKNRVLPVAIGAGAAFVILIVTLIWPKPKKAYETPQDFNAEYSVAEAGIDIKIKYPDTLFSEVSESPSGENLDVAFAVSGKENISMNVVIAKTKYDQKTKSTKWTEINDKLRAVSKGQISGAEIIEEAVSDPLNMYSGKYHYKCTYTMGDNTGAYYGWCVQDGNGNVLVEGVDCRAGKDDIESAVRLRDQFYENNSDKALAIPGSYEPKDKEYKGRLKVAGTTGLNIPVPENMFTEADSYENEQGIWQKWVDDNGAIILAGTMLYSTADHVKQFTSSDLPNLYYMYDTLFDEYIEGKVDYSDRKKSGDTQHAVYVDIDSEAVYYLKVNGREYNEKDYVILLSDDDGNLYCELIYILSPSTKSGIYNSLIGYSLENLKIIK